MHEWQPGALRAFVLLVAQHDDEGCRSRCAKLSVLPQRNKTNAQMSERDTLAKYCERLTLVGLQLSALRLRLRLRLRRSCGGARGCGAVRIPRRQDDYTPHPRMSKV